MSQIKFGTIQWEDLVQVGPVVLTTDVSGVLPVANGGTNSGSYTDGQLLIGNTTGNTLTKATLTGTANQVIVTNGHGSITLSLPQDIGTTSSPTFVDATLTGVLTVNGNVTLGDASGDRVTQNAAITNLPNGLTYVVTHINSSSETLLAARLDEDTSSSWSLVNGSSGDGVFAAKFQGTQSGTNTALNFTGRGTTDTGTNPLLLFVSQIGSAQVATRPCAAWWNLSTSMMEISAGGNFQLTGGPTSPVVVAATADKVSIVGFDRLNTRHAAAGNRVEAIQSERGSPIYVGDDAIDFAATTAIVSVNAVDILSLTSTAIAAAVPVSKYNNIATVSGGIPAEYATIDLTGQTANIGATTLYAVPSTGAGMYRVSAYVVLTTAASVSSTLPNVQIVFTDNQTSGSITIDATPILGVAGIGQTGALTANTVGTAVSGVIVVNAKASTTIQYALVNYASSLAGMAYAVHLKLEAM